MNKLTTQSLIQELSPFVATCRTRVNTLYFSYKDSRLDVVMAILKDYMGDCMIKSVEQYTLCSRLGWVEVEVVMLDDNSSQ